MIPNTPNIFHWMITVTIIILIRLKIFHESSEKWGKRLALTLFFYHCQQIGLSDSWKPICRVQFRFPNFLDEERFGGCEVIDFY